MTDAPVPRRPPPPGAPGTRPAPRSQAPRPGPRTPPDEPTVDPQAAFKGVVIVVITVLVGAVVFVQGLHRPAEQAAGTFPPGTVSVAAAPPAPAVQTPVTRVPPKELSLMIGNAVDPKKPVASSVAARLKAAGYATIHTNNTTRALPTSAVYFVAPEWRDDALAVARVLDLSDVDVAQLPNPAPIPGGAAVVYVIVGREPAGLSETTAAPTTR
jgi:hypothetical protein